MRSGHREPGFSRVIRLTTPARRNQEQDFQSETYLWLLKKIA
jgi:hypothetical protein